MPRYFIEVFYKGTDYSGFQIQQNANSIQAEVEKVLQTLFKKAFGLTGSSRTDAGVHALQNFFHFDIDGQLITEYDFIYNLNSLLPKDIAIKKIFKVEDDAHCRFDVVNREYRYYIYQEKDPFLRETAFYYPYKIDLNKLKEAAHTVLQYEDFTAFSKTRTQVKSFLCRVEKSEWFIDGDTIVYDVIANRFLRGMVKALVGTMLQVGRNKISVEQFKNIIENKDASKANFSPPSHGLFLHAVNFDYTKVLDS